MAITTKTIEYAFNTYNQYVPDNTTFSFGQHTIYIPETNSRRFKSCIIEIFFHDNATVSNSNLGNKTVTLTLGSNSLTYIDSSTDTTTGENYSFLFSYDFTKHFNDFFDNGSSQTIEISIKEDFSSSSANVINASARLIITYEYETTNTNTQIKTVRIPLDSTPNSRLNSFSEANIGTIPIISGWLPESNKVIRDYFITVEGNTINTGSIQSWALGYSISDQNPISGGNGKSPLNSALFTRHIFSLTGDKLPNTGAAYDIHLFITGIDGNSGHQFRYLPLVNTLTITYEYDEPNSNKILNSLLYLYDIQGYVSNNILGSGFGLQQNINIQESGIQFINSAVRVNFCHQLSTSKLSIGSNYNDPINYALEVGSACAGGYNLLHRLDENNVNGLSSSLINWGRGNNLLIVTGNLSGSTAGTLFPQTMHALVYLNYISDKHPSGSHRNTHTIIDIMYNASGTTTLNTILRNRSGMMLNDDSAYYINNFGVHSVVTASNASPTFTQLYVKNLDLDPRSIGWTPLLTEFNNAITEMGTYYLGQNIGELIKRYPDQPNEGSKLEFNQVRDFLLYRGYVSNKTAFYFYNTYHSFNYLITGNLINYSGNGSGVNINIFNANNDTLLKTIQTQNNGVFTGLWYDNTIPLYTTAIQNDNYLGRSLTGNAGILL